MSDAGRDRARQAEEKKQQDARLDDGSLTKEQAQADTIRALKECYPDRWERVWAALGKTSESDKAIATLAQTAAASPNAALGALIGGVIGAALGRAADRSRQ